MAKANKAMVTVMSNPFTVKKVDGKEVFSLAPSFKAEVLSAASEFGGFIQTAEQKIKTAMNLTAAFNEYKRITKGGLPAFVHDCIDATCPNSYGKVGTKERKEITSHKVFVGIEYMNKKGALALKSLAERKALSDAGIDPEDSEKVGAHNKEVRDAKAEAFEKAFCRSMVDFARHGVTETTISNLLITVLRKKEKESDDLNKAGETLRDAAVKAVFKAMGGIQVEPKPETKAEGLMETLKKAAKK